MKKKYLPLLLIIALLGLGLLFLKFSNKPDSRISSLKETALPLGSTTASPSTVLESAPIKKDEKKNIKKEYKIIGTLPPKGMSALHFINIPSDKGTKTYEEGLNRFREQGAKIEVTQIESMIKILPLNQALYIEKLLVRYILPNGKTHSFNALIDSQTGKLISTFNRTKHDDLPLENEGPKGLTPTGYLKTK